MNWLQLAQRVHRESGRSGTGPTSYASATKDQARLFDWVADAWLNLQNLPRDWRWMRRSVDGLITGGDAYTGADLGATDFGRWRVNSDDYTVRAYAPANTASVWQVKWLDEGRFRMLFQDSAVTAGAPQVWTISADDKLMFGPAPDQDYRVKADYYIEPELLADDADAPSMPERHHMLLVWRAVAELAKFDAAAELLTRAMDNHDAMLATLIHDQAAPFTLTIKTLR